MVICSGKFQAIYNVYRNTESIRYLPALGKNHGKCYNIKDIVTLLELYGQNPMLHAYNSSYIDITQGYIHKTRLIYM